MTVRTESIRADELQLGDHLVMDSTLFTGDTSFEIMAVASLRLVGDDVEIGTLSNPERVTTSRGNHVAILPRSVLLRLAD